MGMNEKKPFSGFRSQKDEDEHKGLVAFMAVCAKHGISTDNCDRPGGSASELHEQRKGWRRAANGIRDAIGVSDPTDEQVLALHYIGANVARVEGLLDGMEKPPRASAALGPDEWRLADGTRVTVMRNAAQFREFYAQRARVGNEPEEPIGIDDFLRGVANMSASPAVRNALSIGTDTAGGFSVPSLVMPDILAALVPVSSLLSAGAGIVELDQGAKNFTTAAVNAIPTAAWRAENGAVSESDPTFRGVVATPRSLAFMFKVSRELLADSPNLPQALYLAIAQAFAKELDRAGLRGSGTAPEPRGILNTVGIQSVTNGANGAALASYANLFSGVQALLQADAPMPGAAIMSPRSLVKLGGLLDTTNQPLRVPPMLEPLKFLSTSQVPNNLTVGSSSDCSEIYLGDFTKLAFLFRERMSVQLLQERYAESGQVGFVCHVRADVILQYPAAFAVVTGVRP